MAIDRLSVDNTEDESVTRLILKRSTQKKDKDGIVYSGDYPNSYFIRAPGYFNKDSTLGNKDDADLLYDYQHNLIQARLISESIPDDEYTIEDLIAEYDLEYSAVNLDTMNKTGSNNNRRLIQTSITENTSKTLEGTLEKKKGWGLFSRK
jgi:hypothetical protein